jgi:DNA repair ATPase RecN
MLADAATVDGVREPGPEDLVTDVDKALLQVTSEVSSVLGQVTDLISNLGGAIDKAKIQNLIDVISSQAILISDNVARLSGRLDSLMAENEPHISKTLQNVEMLSADTDKLITDLQKYNTPEFRQKIDDITTNLKTATESLNAILNDLQGLTSDKEMIGKIKTSIDKANTTLADAEDTLGAAKKALDKAQRKISDLNAIKTKGDFTLRAAPDEKRWAGDLDFKLESKKSKVFVEGGVIDIGESDKIRAEIGRSLSKEAAGKLGVYKGKLSVGADWHSKLFGLGTDVYDPNQITWDIFGSYAFSPQLGIVVGVEDLLNDNQANVGLKIKF